MDTSTLIALLRASKEQTAEDLPRLALADWLEEHVEQARAELIRVQCRLARLPAGDPDGPSLRRRELDLVSANAARWVGGLGRSLRRSRPRGGKVRRRKYRRYLSSGPSHDRVFVAAPQNFERGLMFFRVRSLDAFLHHRAQAERRSPAYDWVSGLEFSQRLAGRGLRRILKHPEVFAGLTHLKLRFSGVSWGFARFIALPQLGLLAHLDLAGCSLGDAGVVALAHSPSLSRLTTLTLHDNGVSRAGLDVLASSPNLGRLTTVYLAGNPCAASASELSRQYPRLALRCVADVAPCTMPG
jgi:uncharacterized protein (TIGR02996 family)